MRIKIDKRCAHGRSVRQKMNNRRECQFWIRIIHTEHHAVDMKNGETTALIGSNMSWFLCWLGHAWVCVLCVCIKITKEISREWLGFSRQAAIKHNNKQSIRISYVRAFSCANPCPVRSAIVAFHFPSSWNQSTTCSSIIRFNARCNPIECEIINDVCTCVSN